MILLDVAPEKNVIAISCDPSHEVQRTVCIHGEADRVLGARCQNAVAESIEDQRTAIGALRPLQRRTLSVAASSPGKSEGLTRPGPFALELYPDCKPYSSPPLNSGGSLPLLYSKPTLTSVATAKLIAPSKR